MQKRTSRPSRHCLVFRNGLFIKQIRIKNMAVEKYIAAAGLGLFIMFAGEIITIYNFMQDVPGETESFILEPDPKILQFISIGAAPAVIMALSLIHI